MNNNDERAKEILNNTEIPEEVSPESMKKMLDEKAPAKKRGRISVVGRITAAAAACAVIVGGTVGTMKYAERSKNNAKIPQQDILEGESSSEVSKTVEQAKAPYMSGAESYEQVYELLEKANKRRYDGLKRGQSANFITGAYTEGAAIDEYAFDDAETAEAEITADKAATQGVNNGAVYGGMGGGDSVEFTAVPVEDSTETENTIKTIKPIEKEETAEVENPTETEEPNEEPTEAPSEEPTEELSEEATEAPTEEETETAEDDYSKTHNQEDNVLEADIVKTDGERIYYLNNIINENSENYERYGVMNIAAVDNGEFTSTYQLDLSVDFDLDGDGWVTDTYITDMYLYNDMIAVIGTLSAYRDSYSVGLVDDSFNYDDYFCDNDETCFVSFYTKEDEPQLIGTYRQDGSYSDIRIAPDGYMYLVTSYRTENFDSIEDCEDIDSYIPKCGVGERSCIAPYDILLPGDTLDNSSVLSYTVIGSIDLTASGEFSPCDTKALAGYMGNLYSSADNLYTAVGWDNTDITRISIGGGQIVPEASGTVEGYVKDQFSMSEYNGYFRVASTVNKWVNKGNFITEALDIDTETEHIQDNRVYVLDMDMNIVGSVEGFGENETIKSVSFSGNMGYVVTYEQTDPLFAIDLSDPTSPFITDEFKILGYSTYMQQWDDGLLLGFGADADENGIETGVKLVMFDNSDPYDLKEVGLYAINRQDDMEYIYSLALIERKGLLIAPEKNLIGVPVVSGCWDNEHYLEESKYMFFAYENGEFILRGELSNETELDKYGSNVFERAVYIGGYVYAVSGKRFVAADIETITQTDEVTFN